MASCKRAPRASAYHSQQCNCGSRASVPHLPRAATGARRSPNAWLPFVFVAVTAIFALASASGPSRRVRRCGRFRFPARLAPQDPCWSVCCCRVGGSSCATPGDFMPSATCSSHRLRRPPATPVAPLGALGPYAINSCLGRSRPPATPVAPLGALGPCVSDAYLGRSRPPATPVAPLGALGPCASCSCHGRRPRPSATPVAIFGALGL